jgi:hypothetical protein
LEFKHRQGALAVLGFLEELGLGRGLSSDRLRDGRVLGRTILRPPDDSIPSLSTHTGARTAVSSESKPSVPYWHIWTDADGISHQSRCELTDFHKAPIQPAAAPQWIGAEMRHDATVFVTVLPVGWIGDWHENPRPQWIIPLLRCNYEGLTRSGLVASNVRNSSENFRSTQKLDALPSSFDGRFCKFWKLQN